MLNQKDNDFDDLFRRASDRYPLRTDSADWDRMAAALDSPPPDLPDDGENTGGRRKRRFLWFFLLFPLSLCAQNKYDLLIRNGKIIDGTGNSWY